ncbi:Uncharacterized protein TCM_027285 [Theobroma cacao]|uniref:Leucine-rich repeat-containing N-terminal plant-type domain-containing protein n=1 Tax=Theobroma cacao TaxID=3641 RepID=A0A061GFU3_THECC|nr:Uncharacterized protein TCM_027285 [Theobroma cacao]
MGRQFLKFLVLSVILLVRFQGQEGCLEEEKKALLELKAFVKSDGYDADLLLPSWVGDTHSNCCNWDRVTCNSTTGHVIELSLSNTRQIDTDIESMFDYSENEWYFNISLLQPFKELRSLNLSYNKISDWIQNQGVGSLLRLE